MGFQLILSTWYQSQNFFLPNRPLSAISPPTTAAAVTMSTPTPSDTTPPLVSNPFHLAHDITNIKSLIPITLDIKLQITIAGATSL